MTPVAHSADMAPSPRRRAALNFSMAAAAGVAVANIYYNQPMLGIMERDLPGSATSLVPTATQLGYAAGLFLLVPLGNLIERKRLIVLQFAGLAVALGLAAVAPGATMVILASLLVGVLSTVAHAGAPGRHGRHHRRAQLRSPQSRNRSCRRSSAWKHRAWPTAGSR